MENSKTLLELIDLIFKIAATIIVFLLFNIQKERLDIETKQLDIQAKQLDIQNKQQSNNLVVAEKLISIIFEERNKCIAEDQYYLIDFLIDNNNKYNEIQMNKDEFRQASSARRNCLTGSVAQDAKISASLNNGTVPFATTESIKAIQNELKTQGVEVEEIGDSEAPSGYVAVGAFSEHEKSFRNFIVGSENINSDGTIQRDTMIRSRWSVYLRANTNNTETGSNPILGVVGERACALVLESFPSIRGQTWAAVKLVSCT